MSAALYNSLPTVTDADQRFRSVRDTILKQLAPVFATYNFVYGCCLVHTHCKLVDGELMVSTGLITEPKRGVTAHPVAWLSSGEPYEFSSSPTVAPPPELLAAFDAIVGAYRNVVGLCYGEARFTDKFMLEHTEGRVNILEEVDDLEVASDGGNNVETSWFPGSANPLTRGCWSYCVVQNGSHNKGHKAN